MSGPWKTIGDINLESFSYLSAYKVYTDKLAWQLQVGT